MPRDFQPSAEWRARMEHDCGCALPAEAREAIALFNAGEYYKQHDALEALWAATESPVRELYRAILQIGIAYYHVEGGNWRGALKMLDRGLRWADFAPETCQGVDVEALRRNARRLRRAIAEAGPDRLDTVDRALLTPVPMV
ncbi:MAG: DUF309 domain-containing protein [Chloroflexi bacterium]|nr:DUF309 domain-containing protein [Chloroflexota bacterium]